MKENHHPASFRDNCGFIFLLDHVLYRQINLCFRDDYYRLMNSGLYESLAKEGLLIPHLEMEDVSPLTPEGYRVIRPEPLPFVSYPYEWCFSQLKDAALLTLRIQRRALEFDMTLRDSSAYNVQFLNGRPVLIDTLSFGRYSEGEPWAAYRQFCQHFLAPLALMKYRDVRFGQLLRVYIDGIPLDFAGSQLPFRSKLRLSLYTHIHLHAKYQHSYADRAPTVKKLSVSRRGLLGIIESLESSITALRWNSPKTEWSNYYEDTNYSESAFAHKREIVEGYIEKLSPRTVFDLGANRGEFSRIPAGKGIHTVAFDIDPVAVETNYRESLKEGVSGMLPLVLDLTNPSPGLGWAHAERASLFDRGPADAVMALALIHHLAISNNLPFSNVSRYLSGLGKSLIIEFVPKDDSQVQRLLRTREDIFHGYDRASFERAFSEDFVIRESAEIKDSKRTLYLMSAR